MQGERLYFDFTNRNNDNMTRDIGWTVANISSKFETGGVLVFFPSYLLMD